MDERSRHAVLAANADDAVNEAAIQPAVTATEAVPREFFAGTQREASVQAIGLAAADYVRPLTATLASMVVRSNRPQPYRSLFDALGPT